MAARLRGELLATPPEGVVAASEVQRSDGGEFLNAYVSCVGWQSDTSTLLGPARTLADPPWIENFVPGQRPTDVRAAPPTVGLSQHSTIIEVVDGKQPVVLVDGVPVGDGKPGKYWIPRFREQTVSTADGNAKRTVAPVFVAMRLEDGAPRPQSVEVRVVQRIYEDGVQIRLDDSKAESYKLNPYSVNDLTADAVIMPYPAWITRTPALRIIDNSSLRKYNARAQLVAGSRLWNIAAAAGRLADAMLSDTDSGGGLDFSKLGGPLGAIWREPNARNPVKQLWRYMFFGVLGPVGARIFEAGKALWEGVYNQYESQQPPPEPEIINIPLPDAIAAMRKIIATRANGEHTEKDRSIGLTPAQMRKKGWKADSALFDWMVYGETGINQAGLIETALDPAGLTTRTEAAGDGAIRPLNPLGLGSRALQGNQLDPRGMDPYFCAEDRVEYSVEVRVTEYGGTQRIYTFDALRANALDAGMLMAGYAEMRNEMIALTDELEAKLRALREYGPTWFSDRLFVTDSRVPRSWLLPETLNFFRTFGFGKDRDQFNRRWQEYESNTQAREAIPGAAEPLIIQVQQTMARIRDKIIGAEEPLPRRQERIAYVVSSASLADTAGTGVPDSIAAPGAVAIPDTAGVSLDTYNAFVVAQIDLYRQTLGLPADVVIERTDVGLLRWRDIYAPVIAERYDARLAWYNVPLPLDSFRSIPDDALVRRLPQVCVLRSKLQSAFGTTSVMKTIRVPHSNMSRRDGAKSAVDATVATWRNTTKTFREMKWTLEPTASTGRPFAFHPVEISSKSSLRLKFGAPDYKPPFSWAAYMKIGSVSGHSIPGEVGRRVYDKERTPTSVTIEARESKGDPTADAAVMKAHRLVPSLISWMALTGVADAIVYAALQHGTVFKLKDAMDNPVSRARKAAALAADIVRVSYGRTLQASTLLPLDDAVWAGMPMAGLAHAIVRRFVGLSNVLQTLVSTATPAQLDILWPSAERERATLFELSLRTLSRQTEFKLQNWPFLNLQTMIIQRALLPIKNYTPTLSGIEAQLQAAISSFLRIRRVLERACAGNCTKHAFWALCDAVASRPITLQFAQYGGRDDTLLINTLRRAQADWVVPRPDTSALALKQLAASRLPSARSNMGNARPGDFGDADEIADVAFAMARMTVDIGDTLLVPPCGFGNATMNDISDMHTLEDTITWLGPAADALRSLAVRVPSSVTASTSQIDGLQEWRMVVDRQSHPYEINLRQLLIQGISRIEPRNIGGDATLGTPLPASVMELLDNVPSVSAAERITGRYAKRLRTMIWLVDRFIQLEAAAQFGGRGPQTAIVSIDIPGYGATELSFLAVAMGIAKSLWSTRYHSRVNTVLVVPDASVIPAIDATLKRVAPLLAGTGSAEDRADPLRAMPLCEVCHALVAILE